MALRSAASAAQQQTLDTLREQRQVLLKLRDLHSRSAVDVAQLIEAREYWADEKEDLTTQRATFMKAYKVGAMDMYIHTSEWKPHTLFS